MFRVCESVGGVRVWVCKNSRLAVREQLCVSPYYSERVEIRACVFDYKSIQHTSCLDQRVSVTMSSVH